MRQPPLRLLARRLRSASTAGCLNRRPLGHVAHASNRSCQALELRRYMHVAIVAPGLGDALVALPGARKDKQGHINIPVPDPKLKVLAELERTHPVAATVEAVEVDKNLSEELVRAADAPEAADAELSGSFLAQLRAADALLLAVPCQEGTDPVRWFQAAERTLITVDLDVLERQVCKGGATGPEADLDVAKLTKALAGSKDKAVKRDADELVKGVLAPGLAALRARLRAGTPARHARPGLEVGEGNTLAALDPRFESLALSWLNALVTWKPLLILADVPEKDAASVEPAGNAQSKRLTEYASSQRLPCVTTCVALECETVGLKDEPEFLAEYLESFGLALVDTDAQPSEDSSALRPWRSQAPEITRYFPKLFNLLTYYTAGEKEAKAWMCQRVRKDNSALPFTLIPDAPAAKSTKETVKSSGDGVPACLAARAIHTSFESRVTSVLAWRFEDLETIGSSPTGPSAKEQAKSSGKVRKLAAQAPLGEGDVVEFVLK